MDKEEYLKEKYRFDAERDAYLEWKDQQRMMKEDYCERDCDCHNENCPYYNSEEETWDYESCFEDRGEF